MDAGILVIAVCVVDLDFQHDNLPFVCMALDLQGRLFVIALIDAIQIDCLALLCVCLACTLYGRSPPAWAS